MITNIFTRPFAIFAGSTIGLRAISRTVHTWTTTALLIVFIHMWFLAYSLPLAQAALVRGTAVPFDQDTALDPWTFTIDTPAGTNLLTLLCFMSDDGNTFDTVTHNGDSFGAADVFKDHSGVSAIILAIYHRVNPDIGTGLTISVSMSGTSQDGGCVAIPYSGADTTTPITAGTSVQSDSDNVISNSITCPAGNDTISIAGLNALRTVTTTGGQTELFNGDDGARNWAVSAKAGAGSTSMGYSWTSATGYAHALACVMAATATTRPVAPFIFQ